MNKQAFKERLAQQDFMLLDGAMGTQLIEAGLQLGDNSELFALDRPQLLVDIHRRYIAAGADIIYACTFGANAHKLAGSGRTPREVISRAVELARQAAAGTNTLVALDVGSLGELLEPAGTLHFEQAYAEFKEMVQAGLDAGVDLLVFETMTDLYELKAALLAAQESFAPGRELPVLCTMTFDKNNRTFSGVHVEAMACLLNALSVDAIGVNCSPGPQGLLPVVQELRRHTNLPLIVKANAGLPNPQTGAYDITPEEFAAQMLPFADLGVQLLGGCCGTGPAYIAALRQALQNRRRGERPQVRQAAVCSPTRTVYLDRPLIVGERLNPTGKKVFQQALREQNLDYILARAIEQQEAGADILDVNVGLPGLDEPAMLARVVKALQGAVDLPLQIDSSDPAAIEAALRVCNGKAIVNSVNGKPESLSAILPLVKRYGAAVIGLTLDENGLPQTAEQRLQIARRIMEAALAEGIPKEDIYIDCLTLTVSAQQEQARETLAAIRLVKEQLGLKCVLGVSNISFGLPNRELINQTFLSMALQAGLDLAIINPNIESMTDTVAAARVLLNCDEGSAEYIAGQTAVEPKQAELAAQSAADLPQQLTEAVHKGLRGEVRQLTEHLLAEQEPMQLINALLIPALDAVGQRYEREEIFLPQLINAAAAASEAFEVIKAQIIKQGRAGVAKGKILLATVFGDIHDIGKNIVKVILENYGYQVIDLGRDVPVERVVSEAKAHDIRLIGLSALMTTTVVSMEQTIAALRESGRPCQVFVGGAVLTADYAANIGADFYAKDAAQAVQIAKQVLG